MLKSNIVRRVVISFAFFAVILAAFITGLMMTPPTPRDSSQRAFQEIYRALLDQHYLQPTEDQLYEGAILGMIQSLNDPYTAYYTAEEADRFDQNLEESFVGIGITIENVDEHVVVRTVWPSSPAEIGGVQVGDIITHIDDEDYRGKSFLETYANLLGEAGSAITIKVQRAGESNLIEMIMTREEIDNPSVTYRDATLINDALVGFIAIHSFGSQTPSLVLEALDILEAQNLDHLIIDVRNNGGGYLHSLDLLLDIFLSGKNTDLPYYYIDSLYRGEWISEPIYGSGEGEVKSYEIVVLINEYSASAAELFAAAMHDVGGYTLLGSKTYGKGTVQSQIELTANTGDILHITFAKWLTPKGVWIDRSSTIGGVIPTEAVVQNPNLYLASLYLTDEVYSHNGPVSHHIRIMQEILSALDESLEIRKDGYFDLATQNALLLFQQTQGLIETGQLNNLTAAALSEALYQYKSDDTKDYQLQAAITYLVGDLDD